MKKLFIILSLCISALSVTGCSKAGIEYLDLNEKMLDIKSYTKESTVSFELGSKIPDEVKESMKPYYLPSILNAADDVKISSSQDYSNYKSKQSLTVTTDTSSFSFNAYSAVDGSVQTVYQIPTIAKAFLPEEYTNAEYAAMDVKEINELTAAIPGGAVISSSINGDDAKKLSKSAITFLKNYLPKSGELPEIVTKSGKTYTIKLTSEHFKAITAALVETYITDKTARRDVSDFIYGVIDFYELIYGKEFCTDMRSDADSFFSSTDEIQLAADAAEMIADINKTIRLGDEGLVITSTVGKSGYIEKTDTTADIIFDINEIGDYEQPFYVELKMKSSSALSNINKLKDFDIPKIDGSKTISLVKWLEAYENSPEEPADDYFYSPHYIENVKLPAEDGSITLFQSDFKVDLGDGKLINVDGTIYAPEEFIRYFIGNCAENYGTITIDMYCGSQLNGLVNSDTFVSNSSKIILSKPAIKIDDRVYFPLRSIAELFITDSVIWDGERNCIIMN